MITLQPSNWTQQELNLKNTMLLKTSFKTYLNAKWELLYSTIQQYDCENLSTSEKWELHKQREGEMWTVIILITELSLQIKGRKLQDHQKPKVFITEINLNWKHTNYQYRNSSSCSNCGKNSNSRIWVLGDISIVLSVLHTLAYLNLISTQRGRFPYIISVLLAKDRQLLRGNRALKLRQPVSTLKHHATLPWKCQRR